MSTHSERGIAAGVIETTSGSPVRHTVSWGSWLPIPELSADTMGRFRVVFGLVVMLALVSDPPRMQPAEMHRNYSWLADWPWVHAIASSADACRTLHVSTLAFAGLFIVGLQTRVAYAGLVTGALIGRLVQLQRRGTHDWDVLMITLLALAVIPWGDGFSVDARRRRDTPRLLSRNGQVYGLAIWIPGLVLGLALAAAAYAKLATSGMAWITSGAVRYHFVEDASNAPLTWGLWVAAHPAVAVLLSLGAVLGEATFVVNAFIRSIWWRLAFGAIGLLFFGGLYVFQGVAWLPWLILFCAFLPWPILDRGRSMVSGGPGLRWWHLALIGALVLQQIVASATATEIEPLISSYPMYSGTYASPEEFERIRYRRLQRLFFESAGIDITSRVHDIGKGAERLFEAAEEVAGGRALDEEQVIALAAFRAEYGTRFGADIDAVVVVAERIVFDWERGRFMDPRRVTIARVPLRALVDDGGAPR